MAVETRTLHFTVDPAFRAYCEYIETEGREFVPEDYDLFAAGYRWRDTEPEPLGPDRVEAVR